MLSAAFGRYSGKGGDEQSLLHSMLDTLERGDLMLGNAFYATYFLLCELRAGHKTLVATLLCPKQTDKAAIASLYQSRWHVDWTYATLR